MAPELIDRIPPHNIEAEQSLLGALLLDKEAMEKIADNVTSSDFYKDAHGTIFEVMMELYNKHEPIDLLTLGNRLEEKAMLERVGGRSYLIGLSNVVPTSANIGQYAQIIQKKASLRRLQIAATEISQLTFQADEDVETLLDKAEQKIYAVSQKFVKKIFTPLSQILTEAYERIETIHRDGGGLKGIPTGFTGLDNLLAGLQRSDLVILAARPAVGKTSLVLDMARNAATATGMSVALFSLEMSKEQLVDRMICSQANVDLWKMRTGKLSDQGEMNDFVKLGHAMNTLSEANIFIDDTASAGIVEIRTKARRLKSEHGLDLIIIDYLQLMEGRGSKEGRVQEVAEITRGLKAIARELDVPVVALSQLARAVELNKPAIPRLAHLRESGSIEQDADVVLFIYRKAADPNYRVEDLTDAEKSSAEIHIAKHRNGPTGVVELFFDATKASYRNIDTYHSAPEHAGSFNIFEA